MFVDIFFWFLRFLFSVAVIWVLPQFPFALFGIRVWPQCHTFKRPLRFCSFPLAFLRSIMRLILKLFMIREPQFETITKMVVWPANNKSLKFASLPHIQLCRLPWWSWHIFPSCRCYRWENMGLRSQCGGEVHGRRTQWLQTHSFKYLSVFIAAYLSSSLAPSPLPRNQFNGSWRWRCRQVKGGSGLGERSIWRPI